MLNGSKTFISNGIMADLVIVVARTDPEAGHKGISLLVVERGMAGFERGRNLDKIGLHAQDTAELFFDNVVVPKENLLGEEGSGFVYLMKNLPQERLSIATMAAAACEAVLEHVPGLRQGARGVRPADREVPAQPVRCSPRWPPRRTSPGSSSTTASRGTTPASSTPTLASMAKWWTTELQKKVVDQGVQLHGGYGYMTEYPIAKAFLDSRIQTIYGGTTEIQKEIIGRSLGL